MLNGVVIQLFRVKEVVISSVDDKFDFNLVVD